jgi:hypothetical protein
VYTSTPQAVHQDEWHRGWAVRRCIRAEAGAADRDADDGGARHAISAQITATVISGESTLVLAGIAMLSAP